VTVLTNSIYIDAPPERVWIALATLDALHEFDPGISKSELRSDEPQEVGASRHCELREGGWFQERVTVWRPHREIAFELHDCTLPVKALRHHYTLTPERGGTRVEQRQEYELKYGPVGALLDTLVVRRKWDAGIKRFFTGLKAYVEASSKVSA
jgi:ribosome-associated toxin RatA of RatAB toxin-antitoxin module